MQREVHECCATWLAWHDKASLEVRKAMASLVDARRQLADVEAGWAKHARHHPPAEVVHLLDRVHGGPRCRAQGSMLRVVKSVEEQRDATICPPCRVALLGGR